MKALDGITLKVQQLLRGLTATHRLLLGSLMIILVMALFIVGLYTSRSDLVALPVSLSAEVRTAAIDYLNTRRIPWRDRGGQILVPAEQRHLLLAELTDNNIISPDQIDFEALVRQDSPFLSKAQNDRRWLVATMNHLARTISGMNGVSRADVVIDEPSGRHGIGRANIQPSASVNVVTTAGPLEQEQVNAIAAMVAGAHAELTPARVMVIDANAGRAHHASDDGGHNGGRYLELQQNTTEVYEQKLVRALAYISGVNVAVNVIVDHRQVQEESRRLDEPKQGLVRESTRNVSSANRRNGGEPGVRANTGVSIAGAGGVDSSSTDERSDTAMLPAFGGTDSRTLDPGGYALKINASIGVPRSYFVRLFKDRAGNDQAEPTAEDLAALSTEEIERIRGHVQPLIDTGPKNASVPGSVVVSMIPDFTLAALGDEATGITGSRMVNESLVKYVTLGGLALLSLFMMFMMVRKASVPEELPSADELLGMPPNALGGGAEPIMEAEIFDPPMEGVELDAASLRQRQLVSQLNELAGQKPEETAAMLKKWMTEAGD